MKLILFYCSVAALTFIGCKMWGNTNPTKGDIDSAIQNSILDFLNTEKSLTKESSVFSIYVTDLNKDILDIGISEEKDKVALFTKNEVDYDYRFFPTRFYEKDGNLFYWKDSTISVSNEIINKLYAMNRVDTMIYQKQFPQRTIDEKQKVVHYYFCKGYLNKYQKKRTTIAMNKYDMPKIYCKGR